MGRTLSKSCIVVILFSLILCLASCKKDIPKDIIQPTAMESLLYDYHLAKAMAEELPYEERYKQPLYTNYVLKKHAITQAEFDSSMVWYARHTDELTKIYESVKKRYEEEQAILKHLIALRDNKPEMTQPGDSIDIWYGSRLAMLTNSILTNKLKFDIPADTNFKKHDELVWKLRYTFLPYPTDLQDTAIMAMYIRYENDSVAPVTKKIIASGIDSLVLRLRSDSTYTMKNIQGFIYYPGNDSIKSLLVDNITLMRYHHLQKDSLEITKSDSIQKDSLKAINPSRIKELKEIQVKE